ncbi:MAG: hypothetical protein GXO74_06340 [Calditrichaeota bacterium]|nr:hypothetical protein [Calditrichota bacterium]
MNEKKSEEIDLLDYLHVLIKRRRMIYRNVFLVAILTLLVSFVMPSYYKARTTILPPEEAPSSGLLTALSNTPLSSMLLTETSTTSDLFVQILKSRSVLDGVLQRVFEFPRGGKKAKKRTLLDILGYESLEKGRKALRKKIYVEASQEGIVTLEVELPDPHLAADVANAFVAELDKINKEKSNSRAKNSRLYIEAQLKITEKKLAKASEELARFKEKYKAISLEAQTEAAIQEAGELKGKIIAKEVELGVALQSLKADHISVIRLKKELQELKKQYNYLQYGTDEDLQKRKEFYIPFSQVPEVGIQLAKLMREVKVQETVWQLLNQQYYQAKIQEARDTPTVQALDEAVSPEVRSRPKRKLMVIIATFLAFLFSVFWAYAGEFYENLKSDPEENEKLKAMTEHIKSDLEKVKSVLRKTFRRKRH